MASPPASLTAALHGRYRLDRELGRGGMATVYLAHDVKHDRQVALKVLRPEIAATIGPERFLREIGTTANLRHPHILPLYDSGETGVGPDGSGSFVYYVMPVVEGASLRERLDREKQLPVAEALQITREVADALGYAHELGVIHRDIKPENILLERGHAVVADFGIARAITAAGGDTLTESGVAIGTPMYMSPEQAAGERTLDGRSDQYTLACVLYEMLAGQPPFTGPTVQSVVHQHLTADSRKITDLRPAVPAEVAAALARALAKAPADRFTTLGQFVEALGHGPPRPLATTASRRRLALAAGAAGIVLLLGGLLLMRRFTATPVELGRRTQTTIDPGPEVDPALSRDGRFLAYSDRDGTLMVRLVENGLPLHVVREGDGRGRWPAWLPDGERLLYVAPRGIAIVSSLGGVPRLLVQGTALDRGLALAPDGGAFAYASHDSLYTRPLDGGAARLVAVGHELHSLAWSPDGRWIAYVSGNVQYVMSGDLGNIAPSSVWVAPASGGPSVLVSDQQSLNVSPAWAGARSLLYLSTRDGGRDIYQVELTGQGTPAHTALRLTTGLSALGIAVSLDGSRLAFSAFTETSNVWSVPIPATGAVSIARATPVTVGNQTIENTDVSPDQQWVAFSSDRSGRHQIYRLRLGTRDAEPQQLTADTVASFWASWSPNGKEIAFHRFLGERRMVHVLPAEGGPPVQITTGRDDERSPEWSPDGRHLLLLANWATAPALRVATRGADGNWSAPRPFPVVIGSDTLAAGLGVWSPDGRSIVCGCGAGGLVLAPAEGGQARRLPSPFSTAGWAFPQWSADGRTVYHLTEDSSRVTAVVAVPVNGGAPRVVVRFDDPTRPWHRFGFRVRGERMYFTLGDVQSDIWVTEVRRP